MGFWNSVVVTVTKLASSSPFPVLASGNLSFYPAATDEWETPTTRPLNPEERFALCPLEQHPELLQTAPATTLQGIAREGPSSAVLSEAESSDSRKTIWDGSSRAKARARSRITNPWMTVCFPLRGCCSIMS